MLSSDVFKGIILNLSLLLVLTFVYSIFPLIRREKDPIRRSILGMIIGLLGIGIMLSPVQLIPGVVFDTRSILISIAGLFFGGVPTIIAAVMMATFRLTQGGGGAIPGVMVITLSSALGLLAHRYRFDKLTETKKRRVLELYGFGLVVHLGMLLCMLALPNHLAAVVLPRISLPVMVIYPIGTVLLGLIFFYQVDQSLMGEKMKLYIKHAPMGIFVVNRLGQYMDTNEMGTAQTGYSREDLLAKSIIDLTPEEDREAALQGFEQMLQKGILHQRIRFIHASGELRHWEITAVQLDDQHYLGFTKDVTEGVQQELEITRINESLSQANERFALAARSANLAVWDWEIPQNILKWDDQMYTLYGLQKDQFTGAYEAWIHTLHPDDKAVIDAEIQKTLAGERPYDTRFRVIHSDGNTRIIKAYGNLTRDSDGNPLRLTGINYDITQQYRVEQELLAAKADAERANEAKGRFLANMSHEIRTPMNGFLGMIQLMQMSALTAEQKEYLRLAKSSADSLLAVVNDILDYSKIESGMMVLDQSIHDVKKLAQDTVALFRLAALTKRLDIFLSIEKEVPDICYGDSLRTRQVLSNLIGNAVKFTQDGSIHVDISVSNRYSNGKIQMKCTVTDTGIGISPDKEAQLFKGFSQLDSSTTRQYGGTGLGLSIAKSLAELMGGTLTIESQDGPGSRFVFTWMVEEREVQKDLAVSSLEEPKVSMASVTGDILIVEDDEISRMVLEKILRKRGWRPHIAGSGAEAMAILESSHIDLILLDVQMPDADGYQVTARIREMDSKRGIRRPIIATTAHALSGDREKCLAAGMDDYLAKPINGDELQQKLEAWIP